MAMGEGTPAGGGSLVPPVFMGGTGSSRMRGGAPPKHGLAGPGKGTNGKPGRAGKAPGTKAASGIATTGSFAPRGFTASKGSGRSAGKPGRAGKRK